MYTSEYWKSRDRKPFSFTQLFHLNLLVGIERKRIPTQSLLWEPAHLLKSLVYNCSCEVNVASVPWLVEMVRNETRNKNYSAGRTKGGNRNKTEHVKNFKMDTNVGLFFSFPLYPKANCLLKGGYLVVAKPRYDTHLWTFNAFFAPGNVSMKEERCPEKQLLSGPVAFHTSHFFTNCQIGFFSNWQLNKVIPGCESQANSAPRSAEV